MERCSPDGRSGRDAPHASPDDGGRRRWPIASWGCQTMCSCYPIFLDMPSLTYRAFRKALADGAFAPVYLLHGDDDFLKEAAVRQLTAAAVDPALRDFNCDVRRGGDLTAEALGSLLATPPVMAERRLTVVRDVGALKKDARKALDRYLERPASDAVVVLVLLAGAKENKDTKELLAHPAVTTVEYRHLEGDQVTKWIAHHAEAELGGSITPEAAALLYSAVGNDLPQLAAELDKLLSYTNGAEIDEAAVTAIVGVRRGETLGDFLDAVGARDARQSLFLLPHVLNQPKLSGVQIVMALTTQTLALAWGQAMRAEGLPASRLEGEYFTLLKSGASYPGRSWGEAARAWARNVRHWSPLALDRALDALLAADLALKESKVSSEEQILTSLVLTLCTPEDARTRPAA